MYACVLSMEADLLLSLHLSAMTARMRPMTSFCTSPLLLQSPASSKASAMLQRFDRVVQAALTGRRLSGVVYGFTCIPACMWHEHSIIRD